MPCFAAVTADGRRLAANDVVRLPGGVAVETVARWRDTRRPMAKIVTPWLRIEAKQRRPLKPAQVADPLYGEW